MKKFTFIILGLLVSFILASCSGAIDSETYNDIDEVSLENFECKENNEENEYKEEKEDDKENEYKEEDLIIDIINPTYHIRSATEEELESIQRRIDDAKKYNRSFDEVQQLELNLDLHYKDNAEIVSCEGEYINITFNTIKDFEKRGLISVGCGLSIRNIIVFSKYGECPFWALKNDSKDNYKDNIIVRKNENPLIIVLLVRSTYRWGAPNYHCEYIVIDK